MLTTGPTLVTLWLNDFEDPSDAQSFPFLQSLERQLNVDGGRRTYGNGRLRSYSKAGKPHDWSVSLAACTREQIDWLESHVDRTLIARDDRGNRIFCVYYEVPVTEHSYNDEGDAALNLLELTASLAV